MLMRGQLRPNSCVSWRNKTEPLVSESGTDGVWILRVWNPFTKNRIPIESAGNPGNTADLGSRGSEGPFLL